MIFIDQTKQEAPGPRVIENILGYTRTPDGRLAIELEFRDGTRETVTMTVVEWLALSLLQDA